MTSIQLQLWAAAGIEVPVFVAYLPLLSVLLELRINDYALRPFVPRFGKLFSQPQEAKESPELQSDSCMHFLRLSQRAKRV